ncbi:MAG: DnaJ C-terminal domain-containing protein [Halomonas sp.]
MEFKDYYDILGVDEDADQAAIKRAYRKLARQYHPDVSTAPDAEQRFKEVSEAYEVLKDSEKRAEYDQLRRYGAQSADGGFQPPPDWEAAGGFEHAFSGADAREFSDFFEAIFGRGRTGQHRSAGGGRSGGFGLRGEDLHHRLAIFLEEAYSGVEKSISLGVPEVDERGRVVHRERTLNVKIPPGVAPGQKIRLRGQGGPGVGGGEPGDLYLEIAIAPHPRYKVEGKDVYSELPIAPWEAALGTTIPVQTLGGSVNLKIPEGAQAGQKLRLKGRGLPGKPAGDHYVVLRVVMPRKLSPRARELFAELAEEAAFDPRREQES